MNLWQKLGFHQSPGIVILPAVIPFSWNTSLARKKGEAWLWKKNTVHNVSLKCNIIAFRCLSKLWDVFPDIKCNCHAFEFSVLWIRICDSTYISYQQTLVITSKNLAESSSILYTLTVSDVSTCHHQNHSILTLAAHIHKEEIWD